MIIILIVYKSLSSSNTTAAFFSMALPIEICCFSPPDKVEPPLAAP